MTSSFNLKQGMIIALLFLFCICSGRPEKEKWGLPQALAQDILWAPEGKKIICPIIRDASISSVEGEKEGSRGGSRILNLKGQQEFILFDIDTSPLHGKIITGARLHFRSASPIKAPIGRLGISSLSSQWKEGAAKDYKPRIGISCFKLGSYPHKNWAYSGSTVMDVSFGKGNTLWRFSDSRPPDKEGWQSCTVDPGVVTARTAGLSYGFIVADEIGHIWSLKNGSFKYTYFPNRRIHSRESKKNRPWLEVWVKEGDPLPPKPISRIKVVNRALPAGQVLIKWATPKDLGGGQTVGFIITYTRKGNEQEVPRYLIPMAGKEGEMVKMRVQDLPFRPGETIRLTIKPVDNSGNIGSPIIEEVRVSSGKGMIHLPESEIQPFKPSTELPIVGGLKVSVLDLVDKINPENGIMIPKRGEGYQGGNHLYSAQRRLIRIQAARNESVAFQVNLQGEANEISVQYSFQDAVGLQPRLYQFAYVKIPGGRSGVAEILPDPLMPLNTPFSIPSSIGGVLMKDQKNHSILCELYVGHDVRPGQKKGVVSISVGGKRLDLNVELEVWEFTLPNKLSFIPEMNAYGTVSPYKSYDYYRLAHEHRTCINRLPYGWSGRNSFAPRWNGHDYEWEKWDAKIGPLLDGSAFSDLPRSGEPVDVFYLPFNENWPIELFEHYRPSYWADEAFGDDYPFQLKRAFTKFAQHIQRKAWTDTIFQFYLNNKITYRKRYPKSSAPWLFDEPVNTQDFWALRWYGILWQEAVSPFRDSIKLWYRSDISYAQFERNTLWGILDIEYLGGNTSQKTRMKRDERDMWAHSYFGEYGTANDIDQPNHQPVLWCLSAWSRGAIGVLPWQSIGTKRSWTIAEQTSLFYPHRTGPKPSVRLKAFRRGQQDVEYVVQLMETLNIPKHEISNWLKNMVPLEDRFRKKSEIDAGTVEYDSIDTTNLWRFRLAMAQEISKRGAPYRRTMVDWPSQVWDPGGLPEIGPVKNTPQVETIKPECDSFKPIYRGKVGMGK